MKKFIITSALCLSAVPQLMAQNNITGKIVDEKGAPLAYAKIVADRSQTVKRTANGEMFYLSSTAKKKSKPFRALQEIPAIISDANTSSVKMLNGTTPLILINGNMVNSGIGPISPSDIESVEVINSVSARYLQEGITSILNIKLKKHTITWDKVPRTQPMPHLALTHK